MWLGLTFSARAFGDSVCAKPSILTLRAAPNASSAVTWRAAKYMPFVRVDQKNDWAKLHDLEGVTHYAHAREVTNTLRCVVVKTNVASLHKDPNGASPAADLKTVDRYTPFLRLEDKGDWIKIKDEAGRTAWIHKGQVWKPVMVNSISF